MKLLLVTAPMIQVNTPYPATAYLKGFLDSQKLDLTTIQKDPAIDLIHKLFSVRGLARLKKAIGKTKNSELAFFLSAFEDYSNTIESALAFSQGEKKFIKKIAARDFFPEGPRFQSLDGPILEYFESLSLEDKALHITSLYYDDLADYYRLGADPRFEFARYGEKLAASQPSFDSLWKELQNPSLIDEMLEEVLDDYQLDKPDVIGISAPFAGTVYAALRIGKWAKEKGIPVILGGGYPNTELRRLEDPRIFEFVDFITLDDGERPLLCLLDYFNGKRKKEELFRTYFLDENKVRFVQGKEKDIPFRETGCPTYKGLPIKKYLSMFEMLNPVTRLWTGYFWNKLTLAHGCYWHRCSFCDTNLDYIGRYEADKATNLVDKMEKISKETGRNGFHFVDEAAPPAILRALSEEILKRDLKFEWWGNIRFDKAFTPELTKLMKKAGCIAVTGGLEVASPRVLELIDKGVSIEQVAQVTKAFQNAEIFVHAYLMYGFPTQTTQETVDSLEIVRQLFQEGCLQSAFWHRFAATVHSPVGKNPEKYKIKIIPPAKPKQGNFSENDLIFQDSTPTDHDYLGEGLRKALYNYMHGIGFEIEAHEWWPKVPKTKIPATFIQDAL